ncbi:hypothetical protein NJB14192_31310, partial [Mycobacterium montefiorense]
DVRRRKPGRAARGSHRAG